MMIFLVNNGILHSNKLVVLRSPIVPAYAQTLMRQRVTKIASKQMSHYPDYVLVKNKNTALHFFTF